MCADKRQDPHFGTKLIHVGQNPSQWAYKDVIPPISLSTVYNQPSPGVIEDFEYTRTGNPIRSVLEKCLASLDHAEYALTYSSGMAATTSMVNLLVPGDHLLSSVDIYGGTHRYLAKVAIKAGILCSFIDFADPETVASHLQPNTKVVWFEAITNPLMRVIDVKLLCDAVHKVRPEVLVVVDNSFVTPYFQRPLLLGVDIVMYSVSKYMNGHSDCLMGSLVTNNKEVYDKLYFLQCTTGSVPSSFDCYLVNRGLKTLHLRMERHMSNALAVARYLEVHPKVLKVNYTGLESHPQYKLANSQFTGHCGMISFYINGGLKESTAFLEALKMFCITCSLGGFESLAALPCKMTHTSLSQKERLSVGILDNLIRLSVGLETIEDIISDLEQGFVASGAKDK
ncbi:putative cystathionine gamma-lyase 2 [Adelges cooleyi]|uniref:putative cystathionine gamma-lyase 2 n=1 Tax=Adelges cooleyi TaxID=133065 RepID=UPI00217FCFF7|nr:putative cystathionine gamma-lyase 2 [Adelges cooleyi]